MSPHQPNKPQRTPPHLLERVRSVRHRLQPWGVQALLVSNPRDIRYLTGFAGDDSWALVWARRTQMTIISDFRFQEQIQRQAPHVRLKMRKGPMAQALAQVIQRMGLKKLAMQRDWITIRQRRVLAKHLGAARRLVGVEDGLIRQRAVKDKSEVSAIRRALKIQQEAYRRTIAQIEPGQSEQQIAAFLEYQMRLLGADGSAFPAIVAADANASLPHAVPGPRKVKRGGVVLIDWGACWNGYCSDLTRVVAIGKMPARLRKVYEIVLEAQRAAIDAIAPGQPLAHVDAVARRVIKKAGYAEHFGHSLGHGLGLDVHESPTLSAHSKGVLEPGHLVTVEPGIYLPGIGGIRIEDDVWVTDRGRIILSDLPTDIESTII